MNPMGRTYKDREKKGLPRVPNWARPPAEKTFELDEHKRKKNKDRKDLKERYEDYTND
jgi:hypothetical protein